MGLCRVFYYLQCLFFVMYAVVLRRVVLVAIVACFANVYYAFVCVIFRSLNTIKNK